MRGGEGEEDNGDIYEVSQPQSLTREAPFKVAVGAKLSDRVAMRRMTSFTFMWMMPLKGYIIQRWIRGSVLCCVTD